MYDKCLKKYLFRIMFVIFVCIYFFGRYQKNHLYFEQKPLITLNLIQRFIALFIYPLSKANESDVKALHPLATAHRPKNHNKFDSHDRKHEKNALQQLRSMMPSRGNYK